MSGLQARQCKSTIFRAAALMNSSVTITLSTITIKNLLKFHYELRMQNYIFFEDKTREKLRRRDIKQQRRKVYSTSLRHFKFYNSGLK